MINSTNLTYSVGTHLKHTFQYFLRSMYKTGSKISLWQGIWFIESITRVYYSRARLFCLMLSKTYKNIGVSSDLFVRILQLNCLKMSKQCEMYPSDKYNPDDNRPLYLIPRQTAFVTRWPPVFSRDGNSIIHELALISMDIV